MDNFLFVQRSLAAALYDAAFASALGLVMVSVWLPCNLEDSLGYKLWRRVALCSTAIFVALSAQTYLLAATMTGSSDLSVVRTQYAEVMTSTHAGRVLLCNGALSLIFIAMISVRRWWRAKSGKFSLLMVLIILAAIRAATGHASADGDFTLPELVQFVHLLSIAIWSGGVIATGFFVLPELLRLQQTIAAESLMPRLSQTVTIALLLVALTGAYNSYRGLGASLRPLVHTQWGDLLDIKIALVCVAISMGAYNRRTLRTHRGETLLAASRLAFMLRAEAVVMLIILGASACLANSPPANSF